MPLLTSVPLAAAPSVGSWWSAEAPRPSPSAQLRAYVVLSRKKPQPQPQPQPLQPADKPARLARHSSRSSNSSSCSTAGSDDEALDSDDDAEPAAHGGCLAYESYAAVAARARASSALRWEDLDRRPRLELARLLARTFPRAGVGAFRQARRAARQPMPEDERRAMGVALGLEMSFAFLPLDDLQRAAGACRLFREVIEASSSLFTAMYARQWRADRPLPRQYLALPFANQLALLARQHAPRVASALSTRSAVEARADGTLLVSNNSMLRSFENGAIDSVRSVEPLPWLACACAMSKQVAYYEATMRGCGSVGVAAVDKSDGKASAACGYGFGSDAHVGWTGLSYGYHSNDGDFVFNNGSATYGGDWKPFGPSWGGNQQDAEVTVGCGLDAAKRAIFFTMNGNMIGEAPIVLEDAQYALAVSLHSFGDAAKINMGAAAFLYDIEGYCASP